MNGLDDVTIATTAELKAAGFTPREILAAEDAGRIIRAAHGLWVSPEVYADPELDDALACRTGGVIGYLTAAFKHDLCDAVTQHAYVIVPWTTSRPASGVHVQYIRTRNLLALTAGVECHHFHGWPFRITSPARTVVDLYRIEPAGIRQHSAAALSRYIAKGLPTGAIADIADEFAMWDVLRPEIEVIKETLKGGFAP